jgi:fumarate reductase subunit C
MSRYKPDAKTYVRPMSWWWVKNPYFMLYMIREGSAVFLTLYALVLLAGLFCLALGPGAYDLWRSFLKTPLSIGFHLVALPVLAYHSLTWFQVMPKTAPQIPFDPKLIVRGGLATSVGLSVLILAAVWWMTR